MIKIDGEITIPAPYHIVSVLFEVDQIKRVNPKINKIETLFETPDRVGSRYLQYYDEHGGTFVFDNEVTAYSKSHAAMHYESVARLKNTYMMKVLYSVTRIDATHTHVYYMTTTEGQNFFGRLMVFLTPKKKNRTIVSDFLRNLKKVALEDYRKKENETSQFPYR